MSLIITIPILLTLKRRPSDNLGSIDAVIPAYNEGPCIAGTLVNLIKNPYIHKVICVNDGSTDNTPEILDLLQQEWPEKLVVIHQKNTGKGGALMTGVYRATAAQVFLTDADTRVPHDSSGLGYMLAEIEKGADAVGGVPSSDLCGAGILPHIRATVKMPMIIMKRTFQNILGGAPFIISGACGLFRTEVLKEHPFSDRTKVEDLDLTWTLISNGFSVSQCNRCVVYPQECNTFNEEWKRWRRWIAGYAVCMCLHKHMLLSRFGFFSILPMCWVVLFGIVTYSISWSNSLTGNVHFLETIFPLLWVVIVSVISLFSAFFHRSPTLIFLASFSIFYVLLAYVIWVIYGLPSFITGREPIRDKPTRYTLVGSSKSTIV